MTTKIERIRRFYWDLDYYIRTRVIWCYLKRPWCWLTGHDTQELLSDVLHQNMRYDHFCPRCLKFWKEPLRQFPAPLGKDAT